MSHATNSTTPDIDIDIQATLHLMQEQMQLQRDLLRQQTSQDPATGGFQTASKTARWSLRISELTTLKRYDELHQKYPAIGQDKVSSTQSYPRTTALSIGTTSTTPRVCSIMPLWWWCTPREYPSQIKPNVTKPTCRQSNDISPTTHGFTTILPTRLSCHDKPHTHTKVPAVASFSTSPYLKVFFFFFLTSFHSRGFP